MKIRFFSDLHGEFQRGRYATNWIPPHAPDDKDTVLVLAGDIDVGSWSAEYANALGAQFKSVILVLGNHDLWYQNIDTFYDEAREQITEPNVFLLQNETVTIDDIEFLGTTLWTDLNGEHPFDVWIAPKIMVPDFENIRQGNGNRITPAIWLRENRLAKEFLRKHIDSGKKQVVITHHAPDMICSEGNPNSGNGGGYCFYNTTLTDVIGIPGLWIFGHTHHIYDKYLGNTRVVSNPRGYQDYEMVARFNKQSVIEY